MVAGKKEKIGQDGDGPFARFQQRESWQVAYWKGTCNLQAWPQDGAVTVHMVYTGWGEKGGQNGGFTNIQLLILSYGA